MSTFGRYQTQILGISVDPVASQKAFAEKEHITFPLLSDSKSTCADLK